MRHLLPVFLLAFVVAGCGQSPPTEPETKATQDRTLWKKLSKGMNPEKVRAVLGEPVQVEDQEEVTCWHYQPGQPLERNAVNPSKWMIPRGALLFSKAGGDPKLAEWREP